MTKTAITTPKRALVRIALDEIADDERAHRLRAASFKFQRRLHDIETSYFEAQAKARSDYLAEVVERQPSLIMLRERISIIINSGTRISAKRIKISSHRTAPIGFPFQELLAS